MITRIRRFVVAAPLILALVAPAAQAQNFGGASRGNFRIVAEAGRFAGSPTVEGWVYNDGSS